MRRISEGAQPLVTEAQALQVAATPFRASKSVLPCREPHLCPQQFCIY
jgi:hypothetical protein